MRKMLIVDDEEGSRQYLSILFKGRGFVVETANNGLEAIEKARQDPPGIIISDALMPVMDGFRLCREWKSDPRLKQIPFVFLTGTFTGKKDEELAASLGADLFILKPQMPEDLIALVEGVLATFQPGTACSGMKKGPTDGDILQDYSETLSRKLQDKIRELQEADQAIRESEAKYRSFFENATEGLLRTVRTGRILMANPALCRMLGYDSFDALAAHITDVSLHLYVNPEDRVRLLDMLKQNATVPRFQTRFRKSDGSVIWVALNMRASFDEAGNVQYYEGIVEDITNQRLVEAALLEERRKFLTLAENAPFGMLLIDGEGNFTYANETFVGLFGYSLDDVPNGREWFRKAYPQADYRHTTISAWIDDLKNAGTGRKRPRVYNVICKNGEQKTVRFVPVQLPTGETIMSCEDITEQMRVERAIEQSRTILRSLVDATMETLLMVDRTGNILVANQTLAHRLGKSISELIGTCLYDHFHPGTAALSRREFEGVFETGKAAHFSDEVNGRVYDIYAYPVFDGEGQTEKVVIFAGDVTERKDAEKALRSSEKKYRNIFENATEGIFQITQKGRLISVNPAFARMAGYASPEEMMNAVSSAGKQLHVQPEESRRFVEELGTNGYVKDFVVLHRRKNGQTFWGSINARVIKSADSDVVCYEGTVEDITERRLAEERLREVLSELAEKNAELQNAYEELKESQKKTIQSEKMASIGQLAAGVAHEINNPTGFVISNLNSLQKYTGRIGEFCGLQGLALEELARSEEAQRSAILQRVEEARRSLKIDYILEDIGNLIGESLDGADRVKKIVQDLKPFSRVDDTAFTTTDIHAVLETTLNIVWNELKYRADLRREYGTIPLTKCNPGQLSQVFMNLLVNAAHAIAQYGEITIRTWHDGQHIFVSISDTGSGIPEENMKRLFEPFFTTKEAGKGTGLGLSIACDIMTKHNGEILVASKVDEGTTMTVKIPIEEADNGSGNNDITGRR